MLLSSLRKTLSPAPGDKLIAYWSNDAVVLKKLKPPKAGDFEKEIDETVLFAKENGIETEDAVSAIKEHRAEKKAK